MPEGPPTGIASPFTKSFVSDKSWIDQPTNPVLENAQMIIDKLMQVIIHLQTEISKKEQKEQQLEKQIRAFIEE